MKLLIRWAITSFSLYLAAWFVPGIHVDDNGRGGAGAAEGLGLSIVRSLVTGELRGELSVGPGPLGGRQASIDLPLH